MESNKQALPFGHSAGLLGLGILAVSTGALFVRLADCPPLTKAAWRTGLAALVLAPLAWRETSARIQTPFPWKPCLLAGALLALHFAAWITSLETLSVASSVFLVNTTPLFVLLLSPTISGEARNPRMLLGILLGFGGAALLPISTGLEGGNPLGAILAILGAAFWAGYALVGKRLATRLPLLKYLALTYGAAAIVLILLAGVNGDSLLPPDQETLLALIALALIPQLLGHSLLNHSIRRLPTGVVALAFLLEPVFATLLAAIFLMELPPTMVYWAAPLILGGIAISTRRERSLP
ncbi:MAG: DMT family transporter [bacterium]